MSGAASLVVEVAWSRALSLSLGNSHHAVATVVGSMMTGLFIGSLAASRALPRIRRLPRAYGLLEIGIGICAGLTPLVFWLLPALLAPLYALPGPLFATLRFLLVFLVLLPPTAGMGATLPVLTAALSRGADPGASGRVGGKLYGLNTLGAFTGTILAGFVLLPRLGLLKTTLFGASLSFAVGLAVSWLAGEVVPSPGAAGRAPGTQPERPDTLAPTPGVTEGSLPSLARLILSLYAISGALAMVYEITWTRVLTPLAGTSVYSFTLILGALLAGIGAGSLVLSTRWGARIDPAKGFVMGQLLVGTCAFASTWGLQAFPDLMRWVVAGSYDAPAGFWIRLFSLFAAVVLLPAFLLGGLFPFAARLLGSRETEAGAEVGRVYAWNTAGSLAGSLLAGFVLVTTLGSERTLVLDSAASAALALAALPLVGARRFRRVAAPAGVLALVAFPFLVPRWDLYEMTSGISQLLRNVQIGRAAPASSRPNEKAPDARVVFHREGRTATVTVVTEWSDTWLRVDGKTDASTTDLDMVTQVLLGQLPFFFAREPKDACVIGYGSGVTTRAVLTHPVRLVETIEIERAVIDAAPFFDSVAFRPLEDPRSRLILDDARTALLYRPQGYDVIVSEPSNPWMAGVNNLFTAEFYRLVRERLNPGGVFCQWVQGYEMSGRSLQVILQTVAASFPHTHLFASHFGSDMLLLASDEPFRLAPGAPRLFPDRPDVRKDLARVGVTELADLAVLYISPLARTRPPTRINTDDNSLIQYRAPVDLLRAASAGRLRLTASLDASLQLFFPEGDRLESLASLGRAAARRGTKEAVIPIAEYLEAQGSAARARELHRLVEGVGEENEERKRIRDLLSQAEELTQAKEAEGALQALLEAEKLGLEGAEDLSRAGYMYLNLGRYVEAEDRLDRAVAENSPRFHYQSLAGRGAARFRIGRKSEGEADLLAAKRLDPNQALPYLLYGLALFDDGQREAAMRELREGQRIAPHDDRIRQTLEYLASLPGRS